jgi:hypothetical protein
MQIFDNNFSTFVFFTKKKQQVPNGHLLFNMCKIRINES